MAGAAVERFATRHPIRRAIARVRQVALDAHHDLGIFRPEATRDGFLFASCRRCGAGATVHADSGVSNISEQLEQRCPIRTPQGANHV